MKHLVLIVKVTHNCNMNCIYCYDREKRNKQMASMTLEGTEQILKTFVGKYEYIQWIWHGGEPLLMSAENFYIPFYEKILPKYLNKGTTIDFAMQTNLTMLTKKHIDWILKYNVGLGTSFDGIKNDKYRLGGTLWEEKAKLFNEYANPKGIIFGVGTTVTPEVAESLVESHEYMKKYTTSLFYTPVFGWEASKENTEIVLKGLEELLYHLLTKTNDDMPRPFNYMIDFLLGEPINFCENIGCLGKWFAIDPNMDVYPCGRHWPEEYKLGNLNEDNLKDIVKSDVFYYLKNVNKKLSDKCIDCTLFHYCKCGCYNSRLAQMGTLEKHEDFLCYYTEELHKMVSNAIFNNFDKITNQRFLNKQGEKIKKILETNNLKEKN